MAWSYLQKIQNQLEAKRSKRNSGGLCGCHTLSQTFIIVNWEIQQTCMLCKPSMSSQICCTKVCLDGHSNMLNWFNEVFYPEVRRRTCHPVLLLMDNDPRHSKEKFHGVLFYSQCNNVETATRFWSYCSCQKGI